MWTHHSWTARVHRYFDVGMVTLSYWSQKLTEHTITRANVLKLTFRTIHPLAHVGSFQVFKILKVLYACTINKLSLIVIEVPV